MTGPVDPRLLRHARGARWGVAALVVLGTLSAAATIGGVVAASLLVAALVEQPGTLPRTEIAVLGGVVLVRALAAWAEPVVAARTAGRVVEELRERVLVALARRGGGAGEGAELLGGGLDDLRPWFTAFLPALVLAAVTPPAVLVVLGIADVSSAVIVALTLPLVPIFAALLGWATRARARREWAAGERLAGHFLDAVSGLATLRLFGRARRQADEVARTGEAHRRATSAVLRVAFLSTTALELVATISVGVIAVSVGLRLVEGTVALAPALVAILLAPEAHRPLRDAGARFHDTARASAVLDEVDAVLADPHGAVPHGVGEAEVTVRDLAVRHPGRRRDALAVVQLDARGGELVAVTGPSGSGKSTLLRVLAGLQPPGRGTVRVRGRVVLLPQHPELPHARTVAQAVGDDGDGLAVLARLDPALDPATALGEQGAGLSSGQRRRVALARALADAGGDPARTILLLDEPTAHLDAATEARALAELRRLAHAGAAVLVVAHRPAPIAAADRAVALTEPPTEPATAPPAAPSSSSPLPRERAVRAGRATDPAVRDRSNGSAAVRERREPSLEPGERAVRGVPGPVRPAGAAGTVAYGVAAVLAGIALTAASAYLIVRAHSRPPVLTLSIAVVAVRGLAVARPLLRHRERLLAHDGALARTVGRRRRLVADLAERVPGPVAGRRGHLLGRLVDAVDTRSDGELRGRQPLLVAAVALPVVLAVAAGVAPLVALALLVGLGIAALGAPLLAALATRRDGPRTDAAADDLRAAVLESVAGREELLPRGEEALLAQPRRAVAQAARARRRAAGASGAAAALAQLGLGVATVGAAVAAVPTAGPGSSPELLAILVLAPLALVPTVVELPGAARAAVRGRQARARLREVAAVTPRSTPAAGQPPRGADLRVRGLVAGWGEESALRGLDLDLPPGARVGVTGASGSGKSTLAAVLLRLLDVDAGSATLGGVELAELDADAVRRRVALVGEYDHVFAASVRANLLLAAPEASDADLRAVLVRVRLGGWLAGLDDGLDTVVGTDRVSGGERRRLAAARALLADPDVLVLDELTEGLDADTARVVVADLLDAAHGRSVLLLAHRAEGLDLVDHVVHLASGRLEAGGGSYVKSPAA